MAAVALLLSGCSDDGSPTTIPSSPTPSVTDAQSPQPSSPAGDPTPSAPATSSSTPTSSAPSPTGDAAGNGKRSLRDLLAAGKTALGTVSGSTVISIESERNDTRWEVQVVTSDGVEHELETSKDGSSVLRGPRTSDDDASDRAKHRRRVSAAKIDYRRAADIMAKAVPQGRITELNLDTERGKTVWEGDVRINPGTKHEVKIDAANGEVIQNRVDH